LHGAQLGVLAHPLQLVEDRVLRLLAPVIEEHVLPQLREVGVGLDALPVGASVNSSMSQVRSGPGTVKLPPDSAAAYARTRFRGGSDVAVPQS